jgi:RND family efflux transporter MFP subunit
MNTSPKKTTWIVIALALLVLSAAIGRAIVHRKDQQRALAQSAASAQVPVMTLTARDVHVVAPVGLTRSVAVSGSLTAQHAAIVKAKVAAEVLSLTVREGDHVQANQVIGKLDPQEYEARLAQARQQAASAKAQWQIAQTTLDNNKALVQQGFISRTALDTSESNAAAAKANYEAAQAAVDLASKAVRDTLIRAPLQGQIAQRFAQAGERVGVDGRIVEIVDLRSLELQAPLTPQDVAQVHVGSPAVLRVDGLEAPLQARIARINPSATADTRSVMVYLSVQSHPALRQGLFAQGDIQLSRHEALAVPLSAITRASGHDRVLRVLDGRVVSTPVRVGESRGQRSDGQVMQEILQGLQPGDTVLLNASGTIQEGQAVRLPASAPVPARPAASAAP